MCNNALCLTFFAEAASTLWLACARKLATRRPPAGSGHAVATVPCFSQTEPRFSLAELGGCESDLVQAKRGLSAVSRCLSRSSGVRTFRAGFDRPHGFFHVRTLVGKGQQRAVEPLSGYWIRQRPCRFSACRNYLLEKGCDQREAASPTGKPPPSGARAERARETIEARFGQTQPSPDSHHKICVTRHRAPENQIVTACDDKSARIHSPLDTLF